MAHKNCIAMTIPLVAMLTGCGWMQPKEGDIRFSEDAAITSLQVVETGGDFALFYAGQEKPEVPVRIGPGESIGFFREEDGRLKAVAGPFKMDMDPKVREAYWKRMPVID